MSAGWEGNEIYGSVWPRGTMHCFRDQKACKYLQKWALEKEKPSHLLYKLLKNHENPWFGVTLKQKLQSLQVNVTAFQVGYGNFIAFTSH